MPASIVSQTMQALVALAVMGASENCAIAQEAHVIDQAIDATCSAFLAPVLGRKDIAILVAERSIDSAVVCSCAKTSVHEDRRLAEYLAMDNNAFNQRFEEPRARSYVLGRLLNSVLSCFATELNATLAASTAIK